MGSLGRDWLKVVAWALLLLILQPVILVLSHGTAAMLSTFVAFIPNPSILIIVFDILRGSVTGVFCIGYVYVVSMNKTYHTKVKWACFIALSILYTPIAILFMQESYTHRGSLFYSHWLLGDIALSCIIVLVTYLTFFLWKAIYKTIRACG